MKKRQIARPAPPGRDRRRALPWARSDQLSRRTHHARTRTRASFDRPGRGRPLRRGDRGVLSRRRVDAGEPRSAAPRPRHP